MFGSYLDLTTTYLSISILYEFSVKTNEQFLGISAFKVPR